MFNKAIEYCLQYISNETTLAPSCMSKCNIQMETRASFSMGMLRCDKLNLKSDPDEAQYIPPLPIQKHELETNCSWPFHKSFRDGSDFSRQTLKMASPCSCHFLFPLYKMSLSQTGKQHHAYHCERSGTRERLIAHVSVREEAHLDTLEWLHVSARQMATGLQHLEAFHQPRKSNLPSRCPKYCQLLAVDTDFPLNEGWDKVNSVQSRRQNI